MSIYAEKVYSELPEVNWDSCGFDACDGAGNAVVYHYI
jgi:Na+-translocating ferredoxin:NAD+ oxidoreductase RNF subunit RnfB